VLFAEPTESVAFKVALTVGVKGVVVVVESAVGSWLLGGSSVLVSSASVFEPKKLEILFPISKNF